MSATARPIARLGRAVRSGQLLAAEAAARECRRVPLDLSLGICLLMAEREDPRFERAARRWGERLLAEPRRGTLLQCARILEALAAVGAADRRGLGRLALALRAAELGSEARVVEEFMDRGA